MAVLDSGNFGTVHESAAEGGVTTSGDTNLPAAYTTAGATCSFDRRALLVMIMHTPPRRTSSN